MSTVSSKLDRVGWVIVVTLLIIISLYNFKAGSYNLFKLQMCPLGASGNLTESGEWC